MYQRVLDDVLEELDGELQEAVVRSHKQVEKVDWAHARAICERATGASSDSDAHYSSCSRTSARCRSGGRRDKLVDCSGANGLQEFGSALGLLAHELRSIPMHHTGSLRTSCRVRISYIRICTRYVHIDPSPSTCYVRISRGTRERWACRAGSR